MPVCRQCKKYSNCLTVDFCEFCGAKDWDTSPFKLGAAPAPGATKEYRQTSGAKIGSGDGCLGLIAGAFLLVLYLGFMFAGLWLVIAVVKWMWEHS
jgi:hypothetical protein